MNDLDLTGERTLPGISRENYWYTRHVVAYEHALAMARGKSVIDIGCGEGYGAAILTGEAASVLGIDIAHEVVSHARDTYHASNLSFEVMDVNRLELADASFDLAVSFQVVEHLADVSGYFAGIARVLKPGGVAFLTTPNRLTISKGSDRPVNPFHLREYTPDEFARTLEAHFETVEVSGIFHAGWLSFNERLPVVDFIKIYEMSKANPRYWTHRALTPLVRPRDFRVGGGDLSRCLDICAVCTAANALMRNGRP
ncbi:MAG: SAM-dependent methyltransferase [Candidatus Anoxymicrobium japonicum]|uniref:SAM-dependent methyltransferase n=1 Tax=Candidatus Anoxymicrobium japonicum TaxID=2013648 RepID=A0A2N3G596_9ACTN|nr:MAG: SAM-dependent methyltransferase [Candidatus Anoxymicrobium japonicum]